MTTKEWYLAPARSLPGLSTRVRNAIPEMNLRAGSPYTVAELFHELKAVIYFDRHSQWPTGTPFERFGLKSYLAVRQAALKVGFKPEGDTAFLEWEPSMERIFVRNF
jgi:hypothetical protein